MGKKNYLIEGVSGAGKTTVATELNRLGYQAIHGDRELRYRGDPITGDPIAPEDYEHNPVWMSEHQLWDLEKVNSFINNRSEEVTFLCGGSRNYSSFQDSLDGIFILEVDKDTMNRRIDERVAVDPTDFGSKPEERELISQLFDSKQDIPKDGIKIDANRPLKKVVEDILRYIQDSPNK